MYGAILGDIAGSRFEFTRPERFDWRTQELFSGMSTYTDDTVLTIATKYAVLTGVPYFRAYRQFGICRLAMAPCSRAGSMPSQSGGTTAMATALPCG